MVQNDNLKNELETLYSKIANELNGKTADRQLSTTLILYAGYLHKEAGISEKDFVLNNDVIASSKTPLFEDRFLALSEKIGKVSMSRIFSYMSDYTKEELALCIMMPQTYFGIAEIKSKLDTPESIIAVANKILDIQENQEVVDLFANRGRALISFSSNQKASYYGFETNEDLYLEACIRNHVSGSEIKMTLSNVLSEKPRKTFDKIFAEIPFCTGSILSESDYRKPLRVYAPHHVPPMPLKSDWIYVLPVIDRLKEGGKAVMIMPTSTAFSLKEASIRWSLLDYNQVEAVVELPKQLYAGTMMPVVMYVFSRKKNNTVRFIDASKYAVKGRPCNTLSDEGIDEIISLLRSNEQTDNAITVSTEELLENDTYTLLPSRQLTKRPTFKSKTVKLKEIASIVASSKIIKQSDYEQYISKEPTEVEFIGMGDIQDGMLSHNTYLTPDVLNDSKLNICKLEPGDYVIMSKMWQPLKSSVLAITQSPTYILGPNQYAIKVNTDKITPYYLQSFIENKEGQFIKHLLQGAAIMSITKESLSELEIPIANLEMQNQVAKSFKQNIEAIKTAKEQLKQALQAISGDDSFDDVRG